MNLDFTSILYEMLEKRCCNNIFLFVEVARESIHYTNKKKRTAIQKEVPRLYLDKFAKLVKSPEIVEMSTRLI